RMPRADRARPGEAVEGAVDLDGPEAGRRVLQFPSLGEAFRVEAATPVPVAPARNADPALGHRPRLPGGYGGKRISRGPPRTCRARRSTSGSGTAPSGPHRPPRRSVIGSGPRTSTPPA